MQLVFRLPVAKVDDCSQLNLVTDYHKAEPSVAQELEYNAHRATILLLLG